MTKDYSLYLFTGQDIPFDNFYLHQPSLREIANIFYTENDFFIACKLLDIGKKTLKQAIEKQQQQEQLKANNLEQIDDFTVLMATIISSKKDKKVGTLQQNLIKLLKLCFPQSKNIQFDERGSILIMGEKEVIVIHKGNFSLLKGIIKEIFCLEEIFKNSSNKVYNPKGAHAQRIVQKLQERHKKMSKNKDSEETDSLFGREMSILSVGLGFSWEILSNFTLYQLMNTYKRFIMKENFDNYIDAKMMGAKDINEVPHWRDSFSAVDKTEKRKNDDDFREFAKKHRGK